MSRDGQMARRMETKPGKQIVAYDDNDDRHVLGDSPAIFVEDKTERSNEDTDSDEDTDQWVVYAFDSDCNPIPYFLAIEECHKDAYKSMERWWKAFENGEKAQPSDYGGVSYSPVGSFEGWKDAE